MSSEIKQIDIVTLVHKSTGETYVEIKSIINWLQDSIDHSYSPTRNGAMNDIIIQLRKLQGP